MQCEQLFKAVYEKVLDKTSQPYKAVTKIYTFIINKFKQLYSSVVKYFSVV